jgi:protein kinase A
MNTMFHPLLVNLHGCFQDDANLYMIMEYIVGGELYSIMNEKEVLDEVDTRFYGAEIMEALVYIHDQVCRIIACLSYVDPNLHMLTRPLSQNIVYRDLKPENLLIDGNGHMKVTDFGFAKPLPEVRPSSCITARVNYSHPAPCRANGHIPCVARLTTLLRR